MKRGAVRLSPEVQKALEQGRPVVALETSVVAKALLAAEERAVTGKALTPFLLAEVARETAGESLQENLAPLSHNARTAAEIARALAERAARALESRPAPLGRARLCGASNI